MNLILNHFYAMRMAAKYARRLFQGVKYSVSNVWEIKAEVLKQFMPTVTATRHKGIIRAGRGASGAEIDAKDPCK